ncbi:MAG TPA: hypothetical protein PKZ52_07330 [Cellvibrionaceae bacterium]|nr:hypothetical protein [Cellvibrionaceae bacterium]
MLKILVPFVGPSTNSIYAGVHWDKRRNQKEQAMIALSALGRINPVSKPVNIEVTPYLGKGKRGYDVSNYSYTYKLIEDAMVKKGILQDDSPQFVRSVKFNAPVRHSEKHSATLITIEEIN